MTLRFLSLLIDLASAALVLLPLCAILCRRWALSRRRAAVCLLFCLYLAAMFSLTGVPSVLALAFDPALQLAPFVGMLRDGKNAVLNVLLFVPLGIFLPVLWRGFRRWQQTALYSFGLSLAIEAAQLFTYRTTDVNDLLANTAGGLLGLWLTLRLGQGRLPDAPEGGPQAAQLITGVFAGMVFLQPLPAAGLWELWYWGMR